MNKERDEYGLQPFKRGAATPGANTSGEALPDSHNPSPTYAKARADAKAAAEAKAAALEEQRIQDAADGWAESLGGGGVRLPAGSSVCWSGRHGDDQPAKVIAAQIWPLPPMPITELVRRGILSHGRLHPPAFERAVKELVR